MRVLNVHLQALYFMKKGMDFITVQIVMLNYLVLTQNMIVEQAGHHLLRRYLGHLKLKLITHLE